MSEDDYRNSLERWPTPDDARRGKFQPNQGPRRRFIERLFEKYLTEREREIVVLYYLDGEERTLEEVGKELDLSAERVRQLRNRALEKLRQADGGRILQQYWRSNA